MIIHVVAWAFKPEVPEAEARAENEGLARGREIPVVRSMALGPNVSKGGRDGGYRYGYVATFDTFDTLVQFGGHPIHHPYSDPLVAMASKLVVVDVAAEDFDAPPPGQVCARHVVMWSFKDGTTADEKRAVLALVNESRKQPQVRALAYGPNLGRSLRGEGYTHLAVYTFDDSASIQAYRAEKEFHPRLGGMLTRHTSQLTVVDIEG